MRLQEKVDYEKEFNVQLIQFIKASINEDDINHDEIIEFTEKVSLIVAPESSVSGYQNLKKFITPFSGFQNIFYFSTPSSAFGPILKP